MLLYNSFFQAYRNLYSKQIENKQLLAVHKNQINLAGTQYDIKVLASFFKSSWGQGVKPLSHSAECETLLRSKAQEGRKTINELFFVGNPRRGFPETSTFWSMLAKTKKVV